MAEIAEGVGENVASGEPCLELVKRSDFTFGGCPCKDASSLLEEKIRKQRLKSIEQGTGETGVGYRSECALCKTLDIALKVNENVRLLVRMS